MRGTVRAARYVRSWKSSPDVESREVRLRRDGKPIAGTLVVPTGSSERLPGWIAIGGVSRKGRFHPQLMRFVEALASSGAAVLVPEIPEWRRLRVSPRVTLPTIRGAVDFMNGRPEVVPENYGVIGFSFGAPGVAIAASHEDLADQMAGIVLFGGYCSLERTLVCQLTGRHEWGGVDYALSPDPYGRWVVASNYLRHIPGCEDAEDVARALRRLAAAASGQRISAWEPHHDRMITEVRNDIAGPRQKLFDCLATPTTTAGPEEGECRELARRLAKACARVEPLLEPAESLQRVRVPTQAIHGRGDRLVPFTEGLRLMEELPGETQRGTTVTRMINHSKDSAPASRVDRVRESAKLFGAIRQLVNTV